MRREVVKRASADSAANHGSVIIMHGEVQERVAGSSARNSTQLVRSTHSATAARLASARATQPSSPPTLSAHFNESSASSMHSIDGVLIVSPRKMPSISFPLPVSRKILGSGQGGV